MMLNPLQPKQCKYLITTLGLLFIVVCGSYLWSEYFLLEQRAQSRSTVTHPSPLDPNVAEVDSHLAPSNATSNPPQVPITAEEKRIVAEQQHLLAIVDASKRLQAQFDHEAQQLGQLDKQAQQALARLEAQAQAQAQGLSQ